MFTNPSTVLLDRSLAKISLLEERWTNVSAPLLPGIQPVQKKTLIDQQQQLDEVKGIMSTSKDKGQQAMDEAQQKMYQRLVQIVYENKRIDNFIEEYRRRVEANVREAERARREAKGLTEKNAGIRGYIEEVRGKNSRMEEEIKRKAFEIDQKRQDQHMIFKVALEAIMKRLKEYEEECDKKGIKVEKYGHLERIAEEEQNKIVDLNNEMYEVDLSIKECMRQQKELVKRELGDLQEQKNHYKHKYEEAKMRSRELITKHDDFKRRFMQQSRQMHANKERHKNLEIEGIRVVEQKNYLEKENQEVSKQRENLQLIKGNLTEEVTLFRKECAELTERKKILEDYIMKNLK